MAPIGREQIFHEERVGDLEPFQPHGDVGQRPRGDHRQQERAHADAAAIAGGADLSRGGHGRGRRRDRPDRRTLLRSPASSRSHATLSSTRSFADRERGLRSCSASVAITGRLVRI